MTYIALIPSIYVNVKQYGAVGDGATDDTIAIQAAISAAQNAGSGAVFFPPGTYAISAPLTVTHTNMALIGTGNASIIQPLSGFSGSAYLSITGADRGMVRDLSFWGSNFTSTSNPAGDGIQLHGCNDWVFMNLHFRSQNGYAIQIVGDNASDGTAFTLLSNCNARHCLAGYRVYSPNTGTTIAGGILFANCQADACQGGDAYLIEDSRDVTMVGCQGYSNTNASIHIKGGQFVHIDTCDLGGGTPATACVLIENGVLTPAKILLGHVLCQKGTSGIEISSGNDIVIDHCMVYFNQTHGVLLDNSGNVANVKIDGCTFDSNNQNNAATIYDLENLSASGNILVTGCQFKTTNGSGAGKTTAAIDSTSTGVVQNCQFLSTVPFSSNKPSVIRACPGYNPIGQVTAPAFPATTVAATNTTGVDVTAYIANGIGAITVVQVAGAGGSYVTTGYQIAASGWGSVRIPAGGSVKFTYASGAPTWAWFGD